MFCFLCKITSCVSERVRARNRERERELEKVSEREKEKVSEYENDVRIMQVGSARFS